MKYVVCFDIGGTNVKYGVIGIDDKEIKEKGSFPTNVSCGKDVLDNMSSIIDKYIEKYDVKGISISCPGFINVNTGLIIAGNIIESFNGFNIQKYFEDKYGLNVAVDNDANCSTIAEHTMGNGKGYENIVCFTVGTGIGGGVVINNKVYTGNKFMAGEFGFMFINGINKEEPAEEMLSEYASTRVLVRDTCKELNEDIDGIEIFKRAKAGDEICRKNLDKFYKNLAMGIYNVCYILNPDKVLIGGAISQQEDLIDEVCKRLDDLTPYISKSLLEIVSIDRCKFLNDAGLIGSFCNFINKY
ncbi:MAG: ROK family protein [Tyzzerella sp.]|uniref:ROK family protein n=1 Tax=Candidatus Fimicola merdigallinarum TaxID=2840819 RepID=A0A9D9H0T6_9FIRM|nr:ROK family protein [Candidatus Fimicola merdigallinarum]